MVYYAIFKTKNTKHKLQNSKTVLIVKR